MHYVNLTSLRIFDVATRKESKIFGLNFNKPGRHFVFFLLFCFRCLLKSMHESKTSERALRDFNCYAANSDDLPTQLNYNLQILSFVILPLLGSYLTSTAEVTALIIL